MTPRKPSQFLTVLVTSLLLTGIAAQGGFKSQVQHVLGDQ